MSDAQMTAGEIVDRLAAHRTLGGAPREELEWLAAHGSLRQMNAGEVLTSKSGQVEGLYVVLSGSIVILVDRGAGPHRMMEWRGGDVTGLLPYSRLVSPPGDTIAQEPSELFAVHRDQLRAMIRECHEITSILVHVMIDRARVFNSSYLQDEKMSSLGRMSAGLAHELNNPASAIERSAALLEEKLDEAEDAARLLGSERLTDEQFAAIDALMNACQAAREPGVRSPIEQGEREEAVADWLAERGLDTSTAEALADTAIAFSTLDEMTKAVQGPTLNVVLRSAAAGCTVRRLASEIQDSATRISGLVTAVKGFTHMDRATVAEPVDLLQGLDNTVTVLRAKAKKKSASIVVEAAPGLPKVRGFLGELNQIWANLIDNALDAIPESGRVEVHASQEPQHVIVRIIDNGSGIPEEIRPRIFDPFFTTKPVGQGTGLGLDIVWKLVRHNKGDVTVESRPGRTEFRVVLPSVEAAPAGAQS